MRRGFAVLAMLSPLCGQERPAPPAPPILVDTVIATVNDSAIMHSELMTLTAGRIRTLQASGRRLAPADYEAAYDEELQRRVEWYTWAQAAKTFGVVAPELVESQVQRDLEQVEQDQVRDLGSYQAWSRALQNKGQTWPTYARELRVDKMADIAQDISVGMRMQRQANLYVTPRMLRDTFSKHRELFVHDAKAAVAIVMFVGQDAEANARTAAAAWRTEDVTSRALARRFPDTIALDETAASDLVPALSSFALAGPLDRVSDPLPRDGGGFQVAKVVRFVPARNGKFEDRDVQDQLRDLCQRQVRIEFESQAMQRAKQRTLVWYARPPR